MAGSFKQAAANSVLLLLLENTTYAGIGDGTGLEGSATPGSFYIALYTVAPTDTAAGTECSYTGYARVAIARAGAQWTTATGASENTAVIQFAECTVGTETAVAMAICLADVEDADDQIIWADLGTSKEISPGSIPEFSAGDLDLTLA